MNNLLNKHTDTSFKLRVINYYNTKKYKIKDLLNIFNISNGSLYKWLKQYKDGCLGVKNKEKEKLTGEMKCYIRSYVIRSVNFNYKKLILLIKKKYSILISKSLLYKCISSMNLSKKKIRKHFIYTKQYIRNDQIINFKKAIENTNLSNIISIDETSIDTHISNDYGWSKKGKRIIKINKNLKVRYTVISAISNKKILLNKIIKGSANAVIFVNFIKELIELIDPNNQILLDNARIHHAKLLKDYMKTQPNKFIYNVPYSPEYNPIEKVFSMVKNTLKNTNYTNNTIKYYINKAFASINSNNLDNFYKKSLIFKSD